MPSAAVVPVLSPSMVTFLVMLSLPVTRLLVNSAVPVPEGVTSASTPFLPARTTLTGQSSASVSSVTLYVPGIRPVRVTVLLSPFSIVISAGLEKPLGPVTVK